MRAVYPCPVNPGKIIHYNDKHLQRVYCGFLTFLLEYWWQVTITENCKSSFTADDACMGAKTLQDIDDQGLNYVIIKSLKWQDWIVKKSYIEGGLTSTRLALLPFQIM